MMGKDVTRPDSINEAATQTLQKFDRIDVKGNGAGITYPPFPSPVQAEIQIHLRYL
jgi:NAD(P)-dependent dehydrogenase (short-subunit alcohol dehydrogenase family)